MHLIGLTGRARSGKNTVGEYLDRIYGFDQYAMAKPLKDMAKVIGIDPASYEPPFSKDKEAVIPWLGVSARHVWQTLGTEWGRELINRDIWLILAQRFVEERQHTLCPGVVFTDVRFENEAGLVRHLGGTVVHIHRPDLLGVKAHKSEAGIAIGDTDRVLWNNSTVSALQAGVDATLLSIAGVPA